MSVDDNATVPSKNYAPRRALFWCKTFIKQLIARKSMSQIHVEIDIQSELKRTLNGIQLTAIGLGAIIGAGIEVLSGQAAAQYAGPSVIISFVITGFLAFLTSLSFSELAAMMTASGAAYTYTYAALGEYLAWFIGWNYALLYQLAALTVVVSWSEYLVDFIELVSNYHVASVVVQAPVAWNETAFHFYVTGDAINLPAIAITILLTIVLIIGIRVTAIFNLVLVVFKIIILLIFIFACSKYVNRKNYDSFFPPNQGSFSEYGITGMLQACTYVFFAYIGFDSIATVAQEAKTAQGQSIPTTRWIPFAIIASTLISLLIFIGISTVMVGLVPYQLLNVDDPLSVAITATPYGLWLLILMNLGGLAALTTVALTTLLSQTRIFYSMAKDGLLPPIFAKIHSHTKTPWISTIISGTFCAVTSGILPVDIVGETASISGLVTYLFVHIDVLVMRRTYPDMPRPFRVPCGSWLIPTVGSILCILLMIRVTKATGYGFLVWTAIGQIVYFSYGFWHSEKRYRAGEALVSTSIELLPTVEGTMNKYMHIEDEHDLVKEESEDEVEEDFVHYF